MPVYNGASYLRQAMASLRWQTFSDWEFLCVNDGSTDRSLAILQAFAQADARIRILNQDNRGIVEALNRGILAAKADWIARMDCDDVARPDRLATQFQFVQENPNCLVVGSHVLMTDPDGDPLKEQRYPSEHDEIEKLLLNRNAGSIAHPTVLMRRDAVIAAGLYRQRFQWVEDADLWLRLARRGQLANIARVLLHYRLHEQSVCRQRGGQQRERMRQLLQEAHAERGIAMPPTASLANDDRKKPSSILGKWARQAARAGYYRTALKHWRSQLAVEPVSLLTFRVTAEMFARGAVSLLARRHPVSAALPDWRVWDASRQVPDRRRPAA